MLLWKKERSGTLIKVLPIKREVSSPDSDDKLFYDSLLLWYRDEKGVKKTKFVERAQVPFYILKDRNSEEAISPPMFIEQEKVEKVISYSDMLLRDIAVRTDSIDYWDRASAYGASNLKNLLKHNLIYDADMDVSDRYIKNFIDEYEPDINYKLHKVYMDIEVDLMPDGFKKNKDGSIGYQGFPDENEAPCPINIISFFDEKSFNVHSFIHKNPLNEQITLFEQNLEEEKQLLKDVLFQEHDVVVNNVYVNIYDTELEMIEGYLKALHSVDPDFCSSWNQCFDVKTIMNRLKKLYKQQPKQIDRFSRSYDDMITALTDSKYMVADGKNGPIYLTPKVYYQSREDRSIVDRIDYFSVLDGINYFDSMLYYANVRKATVKESYALDAVAGEELGKEKLDYTGYTLKNLPWKNFRRFFQYNVMDVVLLHLLEKKNLDMDLVQRLSEITNTRKEKVFAKTVSLKNFVSKYAQTQGFVMNNNKNAKYGSDTEYFDQKYTNRRQITEHIETYLKVFEKRENFGAYVADPNLNDFCGIEGIGGKISMFIFENVFDEDFSSLYPSIIRAFNLDKNTQVGKFFLLDSHIKEKLTDEFGYDGLFTVSKNEEGVSGDVSMDDVATTLVDSLISHNWSRIGEKYFDLPSTESMMEELKSLHR